MEYLSWSSLPQHILVEVYSYLPMNDRLNTSLVCKWWSDCFHHPALWSRFLFKFDTDVDSEGLAVTAIEKYCNELKEVEIFLNQRQKISRDRACYVMDELTALEKKRLQKFTLNFTGLNPLCFNGSVILDKLKKLFSRKPSSEIVFNLSCIDLNQCNIAFDNDLLSIIALQHQFLRIVRLQNSCLIDNVTPEGVLKLVKSCPLLTELHTFYHCVNAGVLEAFCAEDRSAIKRISLLCNRSDKYNEMIPREAWHRFSLTLPGAEVTVRFHHSMPHHIIIPLLCEGIPLVSLHLKVYGWLTDELVHIGVTFSSSLKYLSFHTSMDIRRKAPPGLDIALLDLVSRCSKLEALHCYCTLSDEVIDKIKQTRTLKTSTLYSTAPDEEIEL